MGKGGSGFTADADGGTTGMFQAKDEPLTNKITSAITQHYAGTPQGGLFAQVFGQPQMPSPEQPDSSIIQQNAQPHSSGILKSLLAAII